MAFTSDSALFKKVGGVGQEAGFPLVKPTGVISTTENTKLVSNAHRNYTAGNRASLINIGAWGTIGPTQSHFFTTSSTSYVEVFRTFIFRAKDRNYFIATADIENCDFEITIYDSGGGTEDSVVITKISRDVGLDYLTDTEIYTDETLVVVRMKSLDGNPAYLYSFILEESHSSL